VATITKKQVILIPMGSTMAKVSFYQDYFLYEFDNEQDMKTHLVSDPSARKLVPACRWFSYWAEEKWVHKKTFTYKTLVNK
jgi:hypothetical protein